jgi:heterodisulfide reductase subunit C
MSGRGDLLPHQVFRFLQLDREDPLHAVQPWLCVGCQTCAARCPQELDLSKVMDVLRTEAMRRRTVPRAARRLMLFNRIFVDQVLTRGRLNEAQLGASYNLEARVPFQNVVALPAFLKRGKLRPGGKRIRDVKKKMAPDPKPDGEDDPKSGRAS